MEAERGTEGPTRLYGGEELTLVLPEEVEEEMSDSWDYTDLARQVAVVEPQQQQVPVIVGRRPEPITWPEDRSSVLVNMKEVVDLDDATDDEIPSLVTDSYPEVQGPKPPPNPAGG